MEGEGGGRVREAEREEEIFGRRGVAGWGEGREVIGWGLKNGRERMAAWLGGAVKADDEAIALVRLATFIFITLGRVKR